MMKINYLFLIFTLLFCLPTFSIFAQDGEMMEKEKFHEVGINATSFINEFLSLNSNAADLGDYMLTYKYHTGNAALRFGLGGRFSQTKEDTDGGGTRDSKNNNFDFRVGYEWKKGINKRWGVYGGIDLIAGLVATKSTTDNFESIEISNNTTTLGGGPVMGVQFFINSHISLATEGSVYFRHNIIAEKERFSINDFQNKDETSTENFADFGLPTALFFIIRF